MDDTDREPWNLATRRPIHDEPPDKLERFQVNWDKLAVADGELFRAAIDSASDERPLQAFLEEKPRVLVCGVFAQYRTAWVLPRPKLGAKYIPDFLIAIRDSLGPNWCMVELESPTMDPFQKSGSLSSGLHHALEQVKDWRRWLETNSVAHERESGCFGLGADAAACIVIGRRSDREHPDSIETRRLREYRRERIEIMSYDRLVDVFDQQARYVRSHLDGTWP